MKEEKPIVQNSSEWYHPSPEVLAQANVKDPESVREIREKDAKGRRRPKEEGQGNGWQGN